MKAVHRALTEVWGGRPRLPWKPGGKRVYRTPGGVLDSTNLFTRTYVRHPSRGGIENRRSSLSERRLALGRKFVASAVVSHQHSGIDFYPLGGAIPDAGYWHPDDSVPAEEKARRDAQLTGLLAGDAEFVLDRLTSPQGPGGIEGFNDSVAKDKIAVLGHSRGGSTVGRISSEDSRITACVILDNIGPEVVVRQGLSIPQMTIRSEWSVGRVNRLHDFLGRNEIASWDVVIRGASHFSFSDLPLINSENYSSELDPERAHTIVMDYLLAFLDHWLKGQPDRLLLSKNSPFPEVHVEQV